MDRLNRGRIAAAMLAWSATPLFVGCSTLARPEWLYPGPAELQRRRAVKFDPYLQDDIGPYQFRLPLMDGSRPRDYLEPVPEVKRSRWWAEGR
jgi:hypothetical protein